jgi:thiamine pyrophosphokinase
MSGKRALVFANGDPPDAAWAKGLIQPADLIIAADGGLRHVLSLGLTPAFLVGDLDSVTAGQIEQAVSLGCQVERYPEEKDQTDLEIALLRAVQQKPDTILILGALGGRIDHELGNLSLLLMPELKGLDVRIITKSAELFIISSDREIIGARDDGVSLLPWGGAAGGISTQGLYYPLKAETLTPDRSRGVSNVMLGATARVLLENGSLLCIHTRKGVQ